MENPSKGNAMTKAGRWREQILFEELQSSLMMAGV